MPADTRIVTSDNDQKPLISTRFLAISTFCVLGLASASLAISWFGQSYGERLSLAGHSQSTDAVSVTIGRDQLALPANAIRFAHQREGGAVERVDLYLLWPEMAGYSSAQRRRFDDLNYSNSLLFLQISQSTMSRDMSGRIEPIYRHLLDPQTSPGPAGLTIHTFKSGTGYEGETLLTGVTQDGSTYAIRCLLPRTTEQSTGSDCQRDIHAGEDLTVLYRFSSQMLGDWETIDQAVREYVDRRAQAAPLKNQPKESTKRSS